jgi:hypothetical protein
MDAAVWWQTARAAISNDDESRMGVVVIIADISGDMQDIGIYETSVKRQVDAVRDRGC